MSRQESRRDGRCDSAKNPLYPTRPVPSRPIYPWFPPRKTPDPCRLRHRIVHLLAEPSPDNGEWLLVATAENNHRAAAVFRALDLPSRMPPNARLWLALASMKCDSEGRTSYSADGYSRDVSDTISSGAAAINWLQEVGLILNDMDEDGQDCYRLAHYDDWHQDHATISGYGPDRGLKRDGLPPAYGRPIDQVISPPSGNLDFTPPTWDEIKRRLP